MGCTEENSVTVQENKKHFHEMSEEEKEKIKKQIEEQDRNLQLDEQGDGESRSYERYNWDELIKKLPVAKTKEDRKKRLDLWRKINEYGNGYISFKRLDYQLDKYLELPNIVKNKGPIKLAFNAASDKYSRYGLNKDDNLIEWMEFRIFLVYLRQYFEYWIMFQKVDNSGDHLINLEEFKKAIPQMKNWGLEISEAEAEIEFKSIDTNNGGTISFEEFCSFAIQKSLDLGEDDGFDDEELKNLK